MAKAKASAKASAWRKDRITSEVDPDTGRRIVELPTVKGMTAAQRDAVFAFEASVIGTVKAVIRMNKRHAGTLTAVVTHKLAAAGIPADLAKFYA